MGDRSQLLDYFEKIDKCGSRLLGLINDLLDLAKLESGKMHFKLAATDLEEIVASVVDEFSSLLSERDLRLHFVAPDFDSTVTADRAKLMQVVRNLLGNAAKFSPEGGTIEVHLTRTAGSIVVSVRDQGMGIPENELDAVFEKFVQSSRTKSGAGGTGLGLSICQEIVTAHQGRIWAENHAEGGAVFCFELPVAGDEVLGDEAAAAARSHLAEAAVDP